MLEKDNKCSAPLSVSGFRGHYKFNNTNKTPTQKTPLVKGGNTKAVNNLATKENKASGTVIENIDRNGKDITPSGDVEKDKENPVDVMQF